MQLTLMQMPVHIPWNLQLTPMQNKIACSVQNPAQARAAGTGDGDTIMTNECKLSNNQGTSDFKCVWETLPLRYSLFVLDAYGCGSA